MAKTFPKPSYFCIFSVVGIKFANAVKVAIPFAYSFYTRINLYTKISPEQVAELANSFSV